MKITYTEKKVMDVIWDKEPVRSREIVEYCNSSFGWKSTTTFTFLKRLSDKGIIVNESSIITSLISKDDIEKEFSQEVVQDVFNQSLPSFLTAFLHGRLLSEKECDELVRLIQSHRENK